MTDNSSQPTLRNPQILHERRCCQRYAREPHKRAGRTFCVHVMCTSSFCSTSSLSTFALSISVANYTEMQFERLYVTKDNMNCLQQILNTVHNNEHSYKQTKRLLCQTCQIYRKLWQPEYHCVAKQYAHDWIFKRPLIPQSGIDCKICQLYRNTLWIKRDTWFLNPIFVSLHEGYTIW
jgi:hypothetical protein